MNNAEKMEFRKEIKDQTELFINNGGRINEVPFAATGDKWLIYKPKPKPVKAPKSAKMDESTRKKIAAGMQKRTINFIEKCSNVLMAIEFQELNREELEAINVRGVPSFMVKLKKLGFFVEATKDHPRYHGDTVGKRVKYKYTPSKNKINNQMAKDILENILSKKQS